MVAAKQTESAPVHKIITHTITRDHGSGNLCCLLNVIGSTCCVSNQYLGGDSSLTCSFETQTMLDKKVVELVRKQHEKALKILQDNIGKLHELAQYMYEHETITGEEFMKILETPTPVVEDTLKTSEEETDKI